MYSIKLMVFTAPTPDFKFGIQSLIEDYYAPFLFKPVTRICVVLVFVSWLASSIYVLPYIDVGLEQVRTSAFCIDLKIFYFRRWKL